ncbi:hypothetical protein D9613_011149 [Agrocybe pediades]|uniref:Uncharacterized protein n=1 Tax=Agrocybe pediades TaxID=84607 RepID=A0A8H4QMQ3_9AGAR|nr:hypothetical protein D9613_011149 [Agrocybe pediades]
MSTSTTTITFDPDAPYPLIPITTTTCNFHDPSSLAQSFATSLSLTHNTILRALNSIWLNAPLLSSDSPEDTSAFAGYALSCASMIRHTHGDVQERIVFPRLQEKLDMRANVLQHLGFEKELCAFEEYFRAVRDGERVYESERALSVRAELGSKLVDHLHQEPTTMSPNKLYAFSKQELKDLAHAIEEHDKDCWKSSATLLPFLITHHRKEDAPDWPVIPSSVRWIVDHVGFHVHKSYWRFSPFTEAGDFHTYYHDAKPDHDKDDDSSSFKLELPSRGVLQSWH